MLRLFVSLLLAVGLSVRAELIPSHRLVDWTPGTAVGVAGGIAQYRPGGASARTTLRNVVSEFSGDNTGATDAGPAIQDAIDAVGSGEVVYLPVGVYKISTNPVPGYKDNYTIRGAGQFTLSRSVNSIGTGTKTFTVPAGLGYTAGCGVWVWVWDRDVVKVSSLTRSGSTATVTTTAPHGFATGQLINTRGATQTEYGATAGPITVTGDNTFTYPVSGTPTSPATGSWIFSVLHTQVPITSITRSGTTATVTTASAHGFGNTEIIAIGGADQAEYNVVASVTVTSSTTFTYTVSGSPATPATGTLICGTGDQQGPNRFMKGTCTSYSGTTLVVDVASSQGLGTYAMWKVSLTVLDQRTTGSPLYIGGTGYDYFRNPAQVYQFADITGSPSAGATSFTVSDASTYNIGDLAQICIKNEYDPDTGEVGDIAIVVSPKGYDYNLRQMTRITGKSGSTITVSPALLWDLPSARAPKLLSTSSYAENVGVEDLAIFAHNSSTEGSPLSFGQAANCWAYRVSVHSTLYYHIGTSATLNQEFRECWGTHRGASGPGGGAFINAYSTGILAVDCVFGANQPATEFNACTHYAFLNNFILPQTSANINTNHGTHGKFALLEGNVASFVQSDGYYGSESERTSFRNWIYGINYYYAGQGALDARRWSYNFNDVGNVLGTPGFSDGSISLYGYPNIGNTDSSGTADASTGDFWAHLNASGSTATGTLTTRTSDTAGVITLDTLTSTQFSNPVLIDYINIAVGWGNQTYLERRIDTDLDSTTGSTITISAGGGEAFLPTTSTAVTVWLGQGGYQEFDNGVASTLTEKGNWVVSGTSGSQTSLGGDTLPNSLAFSSKPISFGGMTWPIMDPSSPTFSSGLAVNPAAYWYYYGELPTPGSTAAAATATTVNVGTFNKL